MATCACQRVTCKSERLESAPRHSVPPKTVQKQQREKIASKGLHGPDAHTARESIPGMWEHLGMLLLRGHLVTFDLGVIHKSVRLW